MTSSISNNEYKGYCHLFGYGQDFEVDKMALSLFDVDRTNQRVDLRRVHIKNNGIPQDFFLEIKQIIMVDKRKQCMVDSVLSFDDIKTLIDFLQTFISDTENKFGENQTEKG